MVDHDWNGGYGEPGDKGRNRHNGHNGVGHGGFGPPPAAPHSQAPPMPPLPPSGPPPVPGQSGPPTPHPYQGQGYGQPPTQPPAPPYGQPSAPGYGQPSAPGYGQPPGPLPPSTWGAPPGGRGHHPHRRRRGGTAALVITVVVAVLAVVGVGGYILMNKMKTEDDGPPADALEPTWTKSLSDTNSTLSEQSGLRRIWTNTRFLVYGDDNGVRAFDPKSGKQKWQVKAPKGGGELCALSPRPSIHGVGAAVFDSGGDDCAYLVAFDTDSGRTLWSKNLKGQNKTRVPLVNVGTDVIMANIGDSYSAWPLNGGQATFSVRERGSDCDTNAAQSERFLVITSTCSDAQPENQMSIRDLEFGDVYTFPGEQRDVVRVLADKPLTVLLEDEPQGNKDGTSYIRTYDDKGKPQHTFPLTGKLGGLQFDQRTTFTDDQGTLLVSSYKDDAGLAVTDLKTGKLLWSQPNVRPVAVDGDKVVALALADSESEYVRLMSYGIKDGTETVKGSLYSEDGDLGTVTTVSLGWRGDSLFMVGERADNGELAIRAYPGIAD